MSSFFQNKKVLVTGAGGELGQKLCRAFAGEGAVVASLYHRTPPPECVFEKASVDFRKTETLSVAIRSLEDKLGGVDILINNAAVGHEGLLPGTPDHVIAEILAVNLQAPLLCARAVLPGMISRRGGCILNVSSLAALHPLGGQSVYAASKGGLESLTRALAVEVAPRNIRVNAVAPGFLDSKMVAAMDPAAREGLLAQIPARRWGTLEEVAEACLFLCSGKTSYMTGQIFHIDGGLGI